MEEEGSDENNFSDRDDDHSRIPSSHEHDSDDEDADKVPDATMFKKKSKSTTPADDDDSDDSYWGSDSDDDDSSSSDDQPGMSLREKFLKKPSAKDDKDDDR